MYHGASVYLYSILTGSNLKKQIDEEGNNSGSGYDNGYSDGNSLPISYNTWDIFMCIENDL